MKKILITGGTTFVSKYSATYFVKHNYEVYVLNRNTKPQVSGVHLINSDRHHLGDILRNNFFDVILDITAYNQDDINDLLNSQIMFSQYIMISSSAVYQENNISPFKENSLKGLNKFWKDYGTNKIKAEEVLLKRVKDAYIIRPPYLYGPMNNIYREAFVFDCAKKDRIFYLPKNDNMKLQFFHIDDLCKVIEKIINEKPSFHIMNVGNKESVTIKEWVTKCYKIYGKKPNFITIKDKIEQRNYFCFYDYEYELDVSLQEILLSQTIDLDEGLKESSLWYEENEKEVIKKPYFTYIENNFLSK